MIFNFAPFSAYQIGQAVTHHRVVPIGNMNHEPHLAGIGRPAAGHPSLAGIAGKIVLDDTEASQLLAKDLTR